MATIACDMHAVLLSAEVNNNEDSTCSKGMQCTRLLHMLQVSRLCCRSLLLHNNLNSSSNKAHLAKNKDEEGDDAEKASREEEGPTPGLKLRHMLGNALGHVRHHNLGHTATCMHAPNISF